MKRIDHQRKFVGCSGTVFFLTEAQPGESVPHGAGIYVLHGHFREDMCQPDLILPGHTAFLDGALYKLHLDLVSMSTIEWYFCYLELDDPDQRELYATDLQMEHLFHTQAA